MTVVIKIAVPDGIVMGSDSRSLSLRPDKRPQVFDGAKKVFRLHKNYPIGVMTWGLNRLDGISLEQYMTDIRNRLEGRDPKHADWKIDIDKVTVGELSEKVVNYLFHDHYLKAKIPKDNPAYSTMNFNFAGYSPGKAKPEHVIYSLTPDHLMGPDVSHGPVQLNATGGTHLARIIGGADDSLAGRLVAAGADKELVNGTLRKLKLLAMQDLLQASMPLYEVAGLVRSLLNTQINLSRLTPEPDTVGGDIQMIVIDRQGCREMNFKPISFDIPQSLWNRR